MPCRRHYHRGHGHALQEVLRREEGYGFVERHYVERVELKVCKSVSS